jgi:uncharacterized protein DUF4241
MSQPDSLPDFTKAFQDGLVVEPPEEDEDEDERYTLHVRTIGELVVTSGQIVACDPLAMPDTPPFADRVAAGRYPVLLSVAEAKSGDQRVAFALLRLTEHPVMRWENAAPQGKSLSDLQPERIFAYGVDAGTGCFMDAEAAQALQARQKAALARGEDDDELFDALMKTYVHTWSWANVVMEEAGGANVVAFSSGWGDGAYPCYWGYDVGGQRVALMTDFGVFDAAWLAG